MTVSYASKICLQFHDSTIKDFWKQERVKDLINEKFNVLKNKMFILCTFSFQNVHESSNNFFFVLIQFLHCHFFDLLRF